MPENIGQDRAVARGEIADLEAAMATRTHAFHEAGHVWAAHRSDLDPRAASITTDRPAFRAQRDDITDWIAAMGYLAQALLIEADHARVDPESWVPAFDDWPASPLSPHADDFDVTSLIEHMDDIRADDIRADGCCCRRGGDESVTDLLQDEEWVHFMLTAILIEWLSVEALAERLMDGDEVGADDIERCLSVVVM